MLRFARAPDGEIGFDVRARLPGRGAWTCADTGCIAKAVAKGGFGRAFEAPVLAPADLVQRVKTTLEGEALAGLGLLRRASRLSAGRDDVTRALAAGTVSAIVLARDLSERTVREVRTRAGELPLVVALTQAGIGQAVGRKPTGVLALLDGPRAAHVFLDLVRLARIEGTFSPTSLAEQADGA